jgi:hypothetical protein
MAGGLKSANICKMTLRGQAYDALQCSTRTLGALIRCDAIPGMEKIPLEGGDANADDEIATCDGRHKGRMRTVNHKSNTRSRPVLPSDLALDFQKFPCKQIGTGAVYGMVAALLYFVFPMYASVEFQPGFRDNETAIHGMDEGT